MGTSCILEGRADRTLSGRRCALLALLLLPAPGTLFATGFHVTVGGSSSGTGAAGSPWDLQTGLSQTAVVRPGDTLWVHGGIYDGPFVSSLTGSAGQPVIVRNFNGERATISVSTLDPALTIEGSFARYWGLEITAANLDTAVGGSGGINIVGDNNALINCIVHDMLGDGIEDQNCRNTLIYGCLVYYNGRKTNNDNYAYGVYGQSSVGHKVYRDNFFIHNFGSYQVHIYTEQGAIDSFRIAHNVLTNYANSATFLIGGGPHPARDCWIDSNYIYGTENPSFGIVQVAYHEHAELENPRIRGNYFMRGKLLFDSGTAGRLFTGNINYGESPAYTSGTSVNTAAYSQNAWFTAPFGTDPPRPTGIWTFVRPNLYEAGRGNVIVYNWDDSDAVDVDLAGLLDPGEEFFVLDAQNVFGGPLLTGTYGGGTVRIPMTSASMPDPVSYPALLGRPEHTGRIFGTFIVTTPGGGFATGIRTNVPAPGGYSLQSNYPNPFNPATVIRYRIAASGRVHLRVYDLLGREVASLVDAEQTAGEHTARWIASGMASGIYFYRLTAGGFVATGKMSLVR